MAYTDNAGVRTHKREVAGVDVYAYRDADEWVVSTPSMATVQRFSTSLWSMADAIAFTAKAAPS